MALEKLSTVMGYEISKDSVQIVETKGALRASFFGFLAVLAFISAGVSGYAMYNNEHSGVVGVFNSQPVLTWSILLLVAFAFYAQQRSHYVQIVFKSGDKRKSSVASEATITALRKHVNKLLEPEHEPATGHVTTFGNMSVPEISIFQISLKVTILGVVGWCIALLCGLGVLGAILAFFGGLFQGEFDDMGYAFLGGLVNFVLLSAGVLVTVYFGQKPAISYIGEGGTIYHATGSMGKEEKLRKELRPIAESVFGEKYYIKSPMS